MTHILAKIIIVLICLILKSHIRRFKHIVQIVLNKFESENSPDSHLLKSEDEVTIPIPCPSHVKRKWAMVFREITVTPEMFWFAVVDLVAQGVNIKPQKINLQH